MHESSVTVGVTTYNAEATIIPALESVISQTLPPTQIIVVDDASTDKTFEKIKAYSSNDSRFLVIQNPGNSGVAVSRNRIIELAIGDFIAFFDDDDISRRERLEFQLKSILSYEQHFANGAPVLCHTAREQEFPDGRIQVEQALGYLSRGEAPSGLAVARYALMGEPIEGGYGACATCSQMARTSIYRDLGGFNPALRRCEDFDLAIRVAVNGGHFLGMSETLVSQRMTPSLDKSLIELERCTMMVYKKHKTLFRSKEHFEFCCNWIHFKYSILSGNIFRILKYFLIAIFSNPKQTLLRLQRTLPLRSRNMQFSYFARQSSSV